MDEGRTRRGVTVVGRGVVEAAPDMAVLDVAAQAEAPHAAAALGEAAAALTRMRDAALVAGVDRADLRTTESQLWPQEDGGRLIGYRSTQSMTVRVRDLNLAARLVPDLVAAGGDAARIRNSRLEHGELAALLRRARAAAFVDARERAAQYADLAGRALGEVLLVEELGDEPRPARGVFLAAAASAPPVEPGLLAVTASVLVRWSLA